MAVYLKPNMAEHEIRLDKFCQFILQKKLFDNCTKF